jgi:hypothetical protein
MTGGDLMIGLVAVIGPPDLGLVAGPRMGGISTLLTARISHLCEKLSAEGPANAGKITPRPRHANRKKRAVPAGRQSNSDYRKREYGTN